MIPRDSISLKLKQCSRLVNWWTTIVLLFESVETEVTYFSSKGVSVRLPWTRQRSGDKRADGWTSGSSSFSCCRRFAKWQCWIIATYWSTIYTVLKIQEGSPTLLKVRATSTELMNAKGYQFDKTSKIPLIYVVYLCEVIDHVKEYWQ